MKKVIFWSLALVFGFAGLSSCLKDAGEYTDQCLENQTQIKQSSLYNNTFSELVITPYTMYYKILKTANSGIKPTDGSQVSIRYIGKLLNGTTFDNKFKDSALVFPLNPVNNAYVIPGINEMARLMQKGDSAMVLMPSCFAFGGNTAYGGVIPANASLYFEKFVLTDIRTEDQLIDDYIKTKKYNPDSVSKTTSGLRVVSKIIGTGNFPKDGQTVTVSYRGYLVPSGFLFDPPATQSVPNPSPKLISFAVGNKSVIGGWDEAVKTLKTGGTAIWIMPSSLGYKDKGATGSNGQILIPGYSPLGFEVKLISIQ